MPVESWHGEDMTNDSDWKDDPNFPDYKKRDFKLDHGTFQIIFNDGNSTQTSDSASYDVGDVYFIDSIGVGAVCVPFQQAPVSGTQI